MKTLKPRAAARHTQVALAPPIAALLASAVAGSAADGLVTAGWPVARVRKIAQCTAFLGPAACLAAAALIDDPWTAVGAMQPAAFSFLPLEAAQSTLFRFAPRVVVFVLKVRLTPPLMKAIPVGFTT